MPVESFITLEETPALAAEAMTQIDAALARLTEAERAAFWSSVRKCYNTPYNDPAPRALPGRPSLATTAIAPPEVGAAAIPMAAIPTAACFTADAHAA